MIMVQLTRLTIIKVLELAIVCCIIGLHFHSENSQMTTRFISSATAGGYLVILLGLFAGIIMGTPVNRRVELFFSLVGCALFIASGALVIDDFEKIAYKNDHRDRGLTRGSLCIIEGALLFVDSILTFRGEA